MKIPEKMEDALKIALKNEVRGREVYLDLAEKAGNEVTKKVLKFIAEQEILHIDKIKELAQFLQQKKPDFDYDSEARILEKGGMKKLFGMDVRRMKKNVGNETSDIEAYEMGLKMEAEAFRLYGELAKKAPGESIRKFFELLVKEESFHHELFKKSLDFIKNPASFYAEEEGWILEG